MIRRKRRDPLRRFYRSPARRDRDRILLVAQYRRAILLAGQELPRQWRQLADPSGPTRRDIQRRDRANSCGRCSRSSSRTRARRAPSRRSPARAAGSGDRPAAKLRRLLPLRCSTVVPPRRSPARRRMPSSPSRFSPSRAPRTRGSCGGCASSWPVPPYERPGCAPSWAACARGGDSLSRAAIDLSDSGSSSTCAWCWRISRRTPTPPGRPIPRTWRTASSGRRRSFTRWQEHYNAACVYSLPLLLDEAHRPGRRESAILASLAVQHLEEATACADSGYVASRRDWVLSDDPDLDGLRAETSFKRYEANFFPSSERTVRRPRELHKWSCRAHLRSPLGHRRALGAGLGPARPEARADDLARSWPVGARSSSRPGSACARWRSTTATGRRESSSSSAWRWSMGSMIEVGFPCFADSSGWDRRTSRRPT